MFAGAGLRISIDPDDVRDASCALDGADAELRDIVASIHRSHANRPPALSLSTGALSSQLSSVERRMGALASDYQRYSAWLRREAGWWEQLDRGGWAPGDPWGPGIPILIGAGARAASLTAIMWRTWPWWPSGPLPGIPREPRLPLPPGVAETLALLVPPFGTDAQARVDAWWPASVRTRYPGLNRKHPANDCVSWAFFRRHELRLSVPESGNGADLGKLPYQPSFLVPGTMVSVGDKGTFGHVMILEKVLGSDPPSILVSEMNSSGFGSGPEMTRVLTQLPTGKWQSKVLLWVSDEHRKYGQDLRFTL